MTSHKDPVTGDPLTLSEVVSWHIQRVIRNFWFLGMFTVLTIVWLAFGNQTAKDFWNYFASYLAIVVEGVTAMALINQTRRDAVIIRKLLALEEQLLQDVENQAEA